MCLLRAGGRPPLLLTPHNSRLPLAHFSRFPHPPAADWEMYNKEKAQVCVGWLEGGQGSLSQYGLIWRAACLQCLPVVSPAQMLRLAVCALQEPSLTLLAPSLPASCRWASACLADRTAAAEKRQERRSSRPPRAGCTRRPAQQGSSCRSWLATSATSASDAAATAARALPGQWRPLASTTWQHLGFWLAWNQRLNLSLHEGGPAPCGAPLGGQPESFSPLLNFTLPLVCSFSVPSRQPPAQWDTPAAGGRAGHPRAVVPPAALLTTRHTYIALQQRVLCCARLNRTDTVGQAHQAMVEKVKRRGGEHNRVDWSSFASTPTSDAFPPKLPRNKSCLSFQCSDVCHQLPWTTLPLSPGFRSSRLQDAGPPLAGEHLQGTQALGGFTSGAHRSRTLAGRPQSSYGSATRAADGAMGAAGGGAGNRRLCCVARRWRYDRRPAAPPGRNCRPPDSPPA